MKMTPPYPLLLQRVQKLLGLQQVEYVFPLLNFLIVFLVGIMIELHVPFFFGSGHIFLWITCAVAFLTSFLIYFIILRLKSLQDKVMEMSMQIKLADSEKNSEQTYTYDELTEAIRARTEELLFTELQYRSLFDSTAEIILICDEALQLREMNRTGEIFFDVSREHLQGFDFFSRLLPNDRERVLQAVEETKVGSISKTEVKLYSAHHSLNIFLAEFSPLIFTNAAFSGFKILMQNITAEKEEQLTRDAIIRTTVIVENAGNFKEAAQNLVYQFGELFSPAIIFVYDYDKANETLNLSNSNSIPESYLLQHISTYRVNADEVGVAVKTAVEQREIYIDSVSAAPELQYLLESLKGNHAETLLSLPLVASKELLGVLQVLTIEGKSLSQGEIRLARQIATTFSENLFKKNLLRALAVANRSLAEKNAELENFVYSVSHDLKAPLISIQGFASQIQELYFEQLNYEARYCLERVRYNAKNMEDMVTELLELSRVSHERIRFDEANIYQLVQDIAENYWGEYSNKKTIIDIATNLPTVRYPKRRLEQILMNLIGNAVRYTATSETPHIIVSAEENELWWEICVKDNGIGIKPDDQERVFKIFERLSPLGQGSGVGLAIVKKIVEQYGGSIWIVSDEGIGTEMHFTILKQPDLFRFPNA